MEFSFFFLSPSLSLFFFFFGHMACGILVSWPGIEPWALGSDSKES